MMGPDEAAVSSTHTLKSDLLLFKNFIEAVELEDSKQNSSQSAKKITWEEIFSLCQKLKALQKFEINESLSKLFIDTLLKYINMALVFLSNEKDKSMSTQDKYILSLVSFIPDFFKGSELRNTFVVEATIKILDMFLYYDLTDVAKKALLQIFNTIDTSTRRNVRTEIAEELRPYLFNVIDSLRKYGDYVLQTDIMEMLFRIFGNHIPEDFFNKYMILPSNVELGKSLGESLQGISRNFDNNMRIWLNNHNEGSPYIFSILCESVMFGSMVCTPSDEAEGSVGIWVDFSLKDNHIGFFISDDNSWNRLTLLAKNVTHAKIIREPSVNSVVISMTYTKSVKCDLVYMQAKWKSADKNLKLTVSKEDKKKLNRLISEVLPTMFKDVFEHTSNRIRRSETARPVYKPLGIKISKRKPIPSDASSVHTPSNAASVSDVQSPSERAVTVVTISDGIGDGEPVPANQLPSPSDHASSLVVSDSEDVIPLKDQVRCSKLGGRRSNSPDSLVVSDSEEDVIPLNDQVKGLKLVRSRSNSSDSQSVVGLEDVIPLNDQERISKLSKYRSNYSIAMTDFSYAYRQTSIGQMSAISNYLEDDEIAPDILRGHKSDEVHDIVQDNIVTSSLNIIDDDRKSETFSGRFSDTQAQLSTLPNSGDYLQLQSSEFLSSSPNRRSRYFTKLTESPCLPNIPNINPLPEPPINICLDAEEGANDLIFETALENNEVVPVDNYESTVDVLGTQEVDEVIESAAIQKQRILQANEDPDEFESEIILATQAVENQTESQDSDFFRPAKKSLFFSESKVSTLSKVSKRASKLKAFNSRNDKKVKVQKRHVVTGDQDIFVDGKEGENNENEVSDITNFNNKEQPASQLITEDPVLVLTQIDLNEKMPDEDKEINSQQMSNNVDVLSSQGSSKSTEELRIKVQQLKGSSQLSADLFSTPTQSVVQIDREIHEEENLSLAVNIGVSYSQSSGMPATKEAITSKPDDYDVSIPADENEDSCPARDENNVSPTELPTVDGNVSRLSVDKPLMNTPELLNVLENSQSQRSIDKIDSSEQSEANKQPIKVSMASKLVIKKGKSKPRAKTATDDYVYQENVLDFNISEQVLGYVYYEPKLARGAKRKAADKIANFLQMEMEDDARSEILNLKEADKKELKHQEMTDIEQDSLPTSPTELRPRKASKLLRVKLVDFSRNDRTSRSKVQDFNRTASIEKDEDRQDHQIGSTELTEERKVATLKKTEEELKDRSSSDSNEDTTCLLKETPEAAMEQFSSYRNKATLKKTAEKVRDRSSSDRNDDTTCLLNKTPEAIIEQSSSSSYGNEAQDSPHRSEVINKTTAVVEDITEYSRNVEADQRKHQTAQDTPHRSEVIEKTAVVQDITECSRNVEVDQSKDQTAQDSPHRSKDIEKTTAVVEDITEYSRNVEADQRKHQTAQDIPHHSEVIEKTTAALEDITEYSRNVEVQRKDQTVPGDITHFPNRQENHLRTAVETVTAQIHHSKDWTNQIDTSKHVLKHQQPRSNSRKVRHQQQEDLNLISICSEPASKKPRWTNKDVDELEPMIDKPVQQKKNVMKTRKQKAGVPKTKKQTTLEKKQKANSESSKEKSLLEFLLGDEENIEVLPLKPIETTESRNYSHLENTVGDRHQSQKDFDAIFACPEKEELTGKKPNDSSNLEKKAKDQRQSQKDLDAIFACSEEEELTGKKPNDSPSLGSRSGESELGQDATSHVEKLKSFSQLYKETILESNMSKPDRNKSTTGKKKRKLYRHGSITHLEETIGSGGATTPSEDSDFPPKAVSVKSKKRKNDKTLFDSTRSRTEVDSTKKRKSTPRKKAKVDDDYIQTNELTKIFNADLDEDPFKFKCPHCRKCIKFTGSRPLSPWIGESRPPTPLSDEDSNDIVNFYCGPDAGAKQSQPPSLKKTNVPDNGRINVLHHVRIPPGEAPISENIDSSTKQLPAVSKQPEISLADLFNPTVPEEGATVEWALGEFRGFIRKLEESFNQKR